MVFVPPRGRKSIKNRPKIVSKSILNEESKRAPKNSSCPRWLQNRPKLGPCWAPEPSWSRPRAKKKRHRKRHRKRSPKRHQKEPKKKSAGLLPGRVRCPSPSGPPSHLINLINATASHTQRPARKGASRHPPASF